MNEENEHIKYPISFDRLKLHLFTGTVFVTGFAGALFLFDSWKIRWIFAIVFPAMSMWFCVDWAQKRCPEQRAAERLSEWLSSTEVEAVKSEDGPIQDQKSRKGK